MHNGEKCLFPEYAQKWKDEKNRTDLSRLLLRVDKFNEEKPWANRRSFKTPN